MKTRDKKTERLALFIVTFGTAYILGAVLFARPIAGVADNGDFLRIMITLGLEYAEKLSYNQKYFGYAIREFAMTAPAAGNYISTALPIAFAAKALNTIAYSRVIFDIRWLALLYSLLLIAGLRLLIIGYGAKLGWAAIPLACILVCVFADGGYIAYFNSLYSEPASFLGMLLLVGSAAAVIRSSPNTRKRLVWLALLFLSALLLIGAKTQNAPIGLLIAVFIARLASLQSEARWKRAVYAVALTTAVSSVSLYLLAPQQLKHINVYQSVFYGIMKDSPSPEADARELGLPERLAANAGTNFFTKDAPIPQNDPMLQQTLYSSVSHADIALFYLKHPLRLYKKLERAAEHAAMFRPYYLGNFEAEAGLERGAVDDRFAWWSGFKRRSMPTLPALLGFALLICAATFRAWRHAASAAERAQAELWALVAASGGIAFVVPLIGDGEADLSKHLFLFHVCFDLLLAAAAAWALVYAASLLSAAVKAAFALPTVRNMNYNKNKMNE
ncbi:hypothetical protein [Paenibacillus thermotolerans]|uniref:glycan biosynthesis hexose transferase WsfD n=1 Tax=Paenibacillus thermotolerans TaxID=3027807 RepID=UPI002367D0E5|nr:MULTISPECIES: hypothetical protein [unclassified Paenibacillus]